MRKSKSPQRRSGQSLIEFIFASLFFVVMIFLSINTIIAFSVHQYMSYAVFMAARAYQAAGEDPEDQRKRAYQTLQQYIPALSTVPFSGGVQTDAGVWLQFPDTSKALAVIVSVHIPKAEENKDYGSGAVLVNRGDPQNPERAVGVIFDVPWLQLPVGPKLDDFKALRLSTWSFLGREVTRKECQNFFRFLAANIGITNASKIEPRYMEDQGC